MKKKLKKLLNKAKVGDTIEHKGKIYTVKSTDHTCTGCYRETKYSCNGIKCHCSNTVDDKYHIFTRETCHK